MEGEMSEVTTTRAFAHYRLASFVLDLIPVVFLVKVVGVEDMFTTGNVSPLIANAQILFRVYLAYVVISEALFAVLTKIPGRTIGMRLMNTARMKTNKKGPPNFFFGILHIIIGIYGFWIVWWPCLFGKPAFHDMLFGFEIVRNPIPFQLPASVKKP
jgi:hypothetical protein